MILLLAIAAGYLLGSIPSGYLLVRWRTGQDVRLQGSGNTGATNVFRASGGKIAIATLGLDALKGFLGAWIGWQLGSEWGGALGGLAAMAGHGYPVFLRFRGGKAVATALGVYLFLAPAAIGAVALVFAVVVARSRQVSLGSVSAAMTFPLAVWLVQQAGYPVAASAVAAAVFVVYRHRGNLERLREGTEPVFSFRR